MQTDGAARLEGIHTHTHTHTHTERMGRQTLSQTSSRIDRWTDSSEDRQTDICTQSMRDR